MYLTNLSIFSSRGRDGGERGEGAEGAEGAKGGERGEGEKGQYMLVFLTLKRKQTSKCFYFQMPCL